MGAIYASSIPFYLPVILLSILYLNKPLFKLKLSIIFPSDPYVTPWIFGFLQAIILYLAGILRFYSIVFYLLPLSLMIGMIITLDKSSNNFHLLASFVNWIIISLLLYLVPFSKYYFTNAPISLITTSYIIIEWLNYPIIQILNVVLFYLIIRNKIKKYRFEN